MQLPWPFRYIREDFFLGGSFRNLDDLNAQFQHWLDTVANAIESGLSCRQAAERFGVSASSAIRWLDRLKKQGDVAAKRQGGDRKSGRIEAEAAFLLGEVAETPDITLVELQEKLKARGVSVGIGTLWRFFDRQRITFKKRRRRPLSSNAAT
jgi:transposase